MQALHGGNGHSTAHMHEQHERVSQAALPICLWCKVETAIVVPVHTSHRRRWLEWHCQHTQATHGGVSDYSAEYSSHGRKWSQQHCWHTHKQRKEATVTIVPARVSRARRQLGWLHRHTRAMYNSNWAPLPKQAMQGDDCDHSANAGKTCKEPAPIIETTHANHGQRYWDSIADTHKKYKEMTATVVPAYASNARRRLQLHYQHMTAMRGNNSGHSANTCKLCPWQLG